MMHPPNKYSDNTPEQPFEPLAMAELAIFDRDILWKSCLKSNLEQLSHNMSLRNVASLAVAKDHC